MCCSLNTAAGVRKENGMEEMTNEQYNDMKKTLIELIEQLVKTSNTVEEAVKKIEALKNE